MTETAYLAIIPAHRPTGALVSYCAALNQRGISVLLLDDGSGEEFDDVFKSCEAHAHVMRWEMRLGRGYTIKMGIAHAREWEDVRAIATIEADGRFSADDALRMLRMAEGNPDKLVLGTRRIGIEGPRHRRFEGALTRATCRFATGARVRDPQSTLRAFSRALVPFLADVPGQRYEYEINVLLRCTRKRVPILEADIQTNYSNGRRRVRLAAMVDFLRAYMNIVKFALSSFIGFVTDYFLYMLLLDQTGALGAASVPFSNVTARVVSASLNYSINKLFIFKSSESVIKTAAQYFMLAGAILAANTVLLTFLTNSVRMNKDWAKLVTEFAFFFMSWLAQRFVIFRDKDKDREKAH